MVLFSFSIISQNPLKIKSISKKTHVFGVEAGRFDSRGLNVIRIAKHNKGGNLK